MPVPVCRLWAVLAVCFLTLLGSSAASQTCPDALAQAEARYVEGAFGSVIGGLGACLDDTPRSIPARRLLTLAYLRLGEIGEAKRSLLHIFAIQPTYQPDPVEDPPAYQSLVHVVEAQLTAQTAEPVMDPPSPRPPADLEPTEPEPADAEPVVTAPEAPERRGPGPVEPEPATGAMPDLPLAFRYWVGAGSYGGERGAQASGPFQEFADNAGVAFGIGIEGRLLPWLDLFGDIEAGYYPTLSTDRGNNSVFEPVEEISLSPWVRFVTAGARARVFEQRGISLYGALGGGIASGDNSLAGAVSVGAGAETAVSSSMGVFVDGTWTLAGPPRAIDAAATESAIGDLFSALRVGLTYRIGTE